MNSSSRILLNTVSLYVKLIVTIVINLLLVRIVLAKLGVDDYGIYTLIAGVVALLSFLNSALMTSTQRFLSVAIGERDLPQLKNIMAASVIIHLALGLLLVIILELIEPLLFERILNVALDRIPAAKTVYQLMIVSTVITIIAVPYNSLINAREDMWYFAIVEIIVALSKLFIIYLFAHVNFDSLILYTEWILITTLFGIILKVVWCLVRYPESRSRIEIKNNRALFRELLSFTGWNAFGSLAQTGRNQGVVLVINHFFGTGISGVFGISNQVSGNLSYFSQMLTTAVSPQIMKSYGQKDIGRMLKLSVFTSKMAFFLSGLIALPLFIELEYVLQVWLGSVPEHTLIYCRLVIVVFLIMELYPGLVRAIQATGDIKWYQIGLALLLLLPIPFGILIYKFGFVHYSIVYIMIFAEFLTLVFSMVIARIKTGLNVKAYSIFIIKSVLLFTISLLAGWGVHTIVSGNCSKIVSLLIVAVVSCPLFFILFYFFVFNKEERGILWGLYRTIMKSKKGA